MPASAMEIYRLDIILGIENVNEKTGLSNEKTFYLRLRKIIKK